MIGVFDVCPWFLLNYLKKYGSQNMTSWVSYWQICSDSWISLKKRFKFSENPVST